VSPAGRARVAERQASLVAALAGRSTPPPGLDEARVGAVRAALRAKRLRAIESTWPALARSLDADFPRLAAAYVEAHVAPPEAGPASDGRRFALWLRARGRLPWPGRLELAAAGLRRRWTAGGPGPARRLAMTVIACPTGAAIAVRAGRLGERWLIMTWKPPALRGGTQPSFPRGEP
jgi:hypothetical protein